MSLDDWVDEVRSTCNVRMTEIIKLLSPSLLRSPRLQKRNDELSFESTLLQQTTILHYPVKKCRRTTGLTEYDPRATYGWLR